MPTLGSSNSAANKDMMSKILANGDYRQFSDWVEKKNVGKEEIACSKQLLLLPHFFSKAVCCWHVKMSCYGAKG